MTEARMKLAILFTLLLVFSGVAYTGEPTTPPVSVLWTGPYFITYVLDRDGSTPEGKRYNAVLSPAENTKQSKNISARIGTRFGAAIKYEGEESDGYVSQRIVWRFPGNGIIDLTTGERVSLKVSERKCKIGTSCVVGWTISHLSELVEGPWIVQVWVADKVILHQVFEVTAAPQDITSARKPDPAKPSALTQQGTQRLGLTCPQQVRPVVPREALSSGISGKVSARVRIVEGEVREITILSPPTIFDMAVIQAMGKYKCSSLNGEVIAVQDFEFLVAR